MDWIDLAQDRDQWRALVDTVMNLQVPYSVGKFLSSCATGSFSRRAQLHGVSDMTHIADEGDEWGASAPSTLVMEVSEGTVLVGVIIGVSVAVILLFTLALLIDCRTR
jgi:hypothetical protein